MTDKRLARHFKPLSFELLNFSATLAEEANNRSG